MITSARSTASFFCSKVACAREGERGGREREGGGRERGEGEREIRGEECVRRDGRRDLKTHLVTF